MTEQTLLDGFDLPAAPSDRLFFALMPDAGAAERADRLAQQVGAQYGGKPRRHAKDKFHVTLFHVGDFVGLPEHTLAQACSVAEGIHAAPLTLRFDRLASFSGSPRHLPYVLLCDEHPELNAFQATLQTKLFKAGLTQGSNQRRFTPHLTLLYGHQRLEARIIDEPIAWTAHEFVLVHSLIGQGQYRILGRWPLTA